MKLSSAASSSQIQVFHVMSGIGTCDSAAMMLFLFFQRCRNIVDDRLSSSLYVSFLFLALPSTTRAFVSISISSIYDFALETKSCHTPFRETDFCICNTTSTTDCGTPLDILHPMVCDFPSHETLLRRCYVIYLWQFFIFISRAVFLTKTTALLFFITPIVFDNNYFLKVRWPWNPGACKA